MTVGGDAVVRVKIGWCVREGENNGMTTVSNSMYRKLRLSPFAKVALSQQTLVIFFRRVAAHRAA